MTNNPDQNTQVSAEVEGGLPAPSDAPAPERPGESPEPTAHLAALLKEGEKYDPHRHQAMTMIESAEPPGTVVQVFQKGYLLNDRVLRPALVAVAKAKNGSAGGSA